MPWPPIQDTLPHISNLVRWKSYISLMCRLCGKLQTLRHVLNALLVALKERRYDARHDAVLAEIERFVLITTSVTMPGARTIPSLQISPPRSTDHHMHHLCPTQLKPNLVIWNDSKRSSTVLLIELTCSFAGVLCPNPAINVTLYGFAQ